MIAAIAVGLLALAVAAFVLAPLFRPDAREAERVANALSAEQDLTARHAMAVAAIRDLEEDRQTGKIGDADYESMRAKLEARAISLMRDLDALAESRR
jgi:hypothetical protein